MKHLIYAVAVCSSMMIAPVQMSASINEATTVTTVNDQKPLKGEKELNKGLTLLQEGELEKAVKSFLKSAEKVTAELSKRSKQILECIEKGVLWEKEEK